MTEKWNEFLKKNKKNELHYEKLTDDELIRLTQSMTAVCFMGRPECKRCDLRGETKYCPPAAAHEILINRFYEKVEIVDGLTTRYEYRQNPAQIELAAV
jgi:hypothetical protein